MQILGYSYSNSRPLFVLARVGVERRERLARTLATATVVFFSGGERGHVEEWEEENAYLVSAHELGRHCRRFLHN